MSYTFNSVREEGVPPTPERPCLPLRLITHSFQSLNVAQNDIRQPMMRMRPREWVYSSQNVIQSNRVEMLIKEEKGKIL